MTVCDLIEAADVELYFYDELDAADRMRVETHLRRCDACRQRLDDLQAIRRVLAGRPVVDAPPAGDWSGFMRRLDRSTARRSAGPLAAFAHLPNMVAMAATLAIVALGISVAMRVREAAPVSRRAATPQEDVRPRQVPAAATADSSLREATAEHLERSKLVVLGLTALDPRQTRAADWQYERQLAGTLLDDTRLYRQAAQQRGMTDVARVMRDLETVLIETSMSDSTDREALARVQRLIAKRDLVVKMQLVGTN
jgi:putative zinc finger protein